MKVYDIKLGNQGYYTNDTEELLDAVLQLSCLGSGCPILELDIREIAWNKLSQIERVALGLR